MPKKKFPNLSVGRGEKLSVKKGGGLTAKGRAKANRATGSNLRLPPSLAPATSLSAPVVVHGLANVVVLLESVGAVVDFRLLRILTKCVTQRQLSG